MVKEEVPMYKNVKYNKGLATVLLISKTAQSSKTYPPL
jgi:hypothetical protein